MSRYDKNLWPEVARQAAWLERTLEPTTFAALPLANCREAP